MKEFLTLNNLQAGDMPLNNKTRPKLLITMIIPFQRNPI